MQEYGPGARLHEARRRVALRWGIHPKALRPNLDISADEIIALRARSWIWQRIWCGLWYRHPREAYLPWLMAWVCPDCGREG